jgi:protein required for attachment to host cells
MDVTWILVADRGRARLFAQQAGRETLEELADYFNHGNAPGVEMLPHMSRDRARLIHHPEEPRQDALASRFAAELAATLQRGLEQGCYDKLILVAPSLFLALLRRALPKSVRRRLVGELHEDLTLTSARDIRAYLRPRRSA